MLASEALLCSLAVYRGYQSYSERLFVSKGGPSLIKSLIEDSVMYFVM